MLKQIRVPQPIKRLLVILVALIMLLVSVEMGLRLNKLATEDYYIWLPNIGWRFEPVPNAMPGVVEGGLLSISSDGLRGEAYDPDQETIHILTLGGSTTECLYLDQSRTWPELVSTQLADETGREVWIGNAARSAMRVPESVVSVRYLLPQLGEVDYVIAMLGVNDMIAYLRKGENNLIDEDLSRGYVIPARMHRVFNQWPNPLESELQIVERFEQIVQPSVQAPQNTGTDDEINEVGGEYIEWRALRQNADQYVDELPNFDAALAVYRLHLESLIRLAGENDAKIVFVTQPALYAENLPTETESLLWLGNIEPSNDYYSSKALMTALAAYNREMLDICRDQNVLCIDAASVMQGNSTYFYDDVHFNYMGAEAFAKIVTEVLVGSVTE